MSAGVPYDLELYVRDFDCPCGLMYLHSFRSDNYKSITVRCQYCGTVAVVLSEPINIRS